MNQKLGIVVVLNKKYIKGIVTDGDLRRELKIFQKIKVLIILCSKTFSGKL